MPRLYRKPANQRDRPPYSRACFHLLCFGALGCMAWLLLPVAGLQLMSHPQLKRQADQRSLRTITLPASRRTMVDRNGEALALSVPSRDIIADPQRVLPSKPDFKDAKWHWLADALHQTPEHFALQITANPQRHLLFLRRKIESGLTRTITQLHL